MSGPAARFMGALRSTDDASTRAAKECARLQDVVTDLQKKLEVAHDERRTATTSLKVAERALGKLERDKGKLETQVVHLEHEVQKQANLAKASVAEVSTLQANLNSTEKRAAVLAKRDAKQRGAKGVGFVDASLEALREENAALRAQLTQTREDFRATGRANGAAKAAGAAEADGLRRRLVAAEKELAHLKNVARGTSPAKRPKSAGAEARDETDTEVRLRGELSDCQRRLAEAEAAKREAERGLARYESSAARRAEETFASGWEEMRRDYHTKLELERQRADTAERNARADAAEVARLRRRLSVLEESIATAPPEKGATSVVDGGAAYEQLEREVCSLRAVARRRATALEERDLALEAMQRRVDANAHAYANDIRKVKRDASRHQAAAAAADREIEMQYERYRKALDEQKREKISAQEILRKSMVGRAAAAFASLNGDRTT